MAKKPISNNFYRGKRIRSYAELYFLFLERRSVYHVDWGIKSAAVIINLPIHSVMEAINKKKLYCTTK
jgi:hypothetical protein